jgi:hypothetical protein
MSKFYLSFFEQLFKITRLDLTELEEEEKKSERMCETSYNQSGNCTIK